MLTPSQKGYVTTLILPCDQAIDLWGHATESFSACGGNLPLSSIIPHLHVLGIILPRHVPLNAFLQNRRAKAIGHLQRYTGARIEVLDNLPAFLIIR